MTDSYARDVAFTRRAEFAGRNWRSVAGFLGAGLSLVAVIVGVGVFVPTLPVQFCAGVVVGATLMTVILVLGRFGDAQVQGHMAETFTADTFRKCRRWYVIHHLSFSDGDVDTVVVCPAAVLAVETKWHHRARTETAAARSNADRATASFRARKIRSLLNSQHHLDVDVVPVLMTWGPGAPELPRGARHVDGVWELDGDHPEMWTHHFAGSSLSDSTRSQIVTVLEDFRAMRARHSRLEHVSLRRQVFAAFRDGVRQDRDDREQRHAVRSARRPAESTGHTA